MRYARIILIISILANFFLIRNSYLGFALGLPFLLIYGYLAGQLLFRAETYAWKVLFGTLSFFSAISLLLTISFYVYEINDFVIAIALLIGTLSLEYLTPPSTPTQVGWEKIQLDSRIAVLFTALFLIASSGCFYLLISNATTNAIASPWQVLPWYFFITFILATLSLIGLSVRKVSNGLLLPCYSIYFFLFTSVAYFVYQLGYGYDPFIHQGGINQILNTGTLLPKPPYYIGLYSLIIILSKILFLPIGAILKLFLPAAFSLLIPITASRLLNHWNNASANNWPILSILFLPVVPFIMTTPQGFTGLLAILIILLSFSPSVSKCWLLFLAIFATAIQPMYGAPLVLFVLFLILKQQKSNFVIKSMKIVLAVILALVFPLLFLANSLVSNLTVSINYHALPSLSFAISNFAQKNFLMDFIYLYGFNYRLIFVLLSAVGLYFIWKHERLRDFRTTLLLASMMFVNYFIMSSFISIENLSTKSMSDFNSRILELALYFLLPTVLFCVAQLIERANNQLIARAFFLFLFPFSLYASFYFSYPIKDDYQNSKFVNLSQSDIESVQWIEEHATGDYIVLANQMLAGYVISDKGFNRYYHDNIFYYSTPSGAENDIYPNLNNIVQGQDLLANIQTAARTTGVDQVYLVTNDYWKGFVNINKNAASQANQSVSINNGHNFIYYFKQ